MTVTVDCNVLCNIDSLRRCNVSDKSNCIACLSKLDCFCNRCKAVVVVAAGVGDNSHNYVNTLGGTVDGYYTVFSTVSTLYRVRTCSYVYCGTGRNDRTADCFLIQGDSRVAFACGGVVIVTINSRIVYGYLCTYSRNVYSAKTVKCGILDCYNRVGSGRSNVYSVVCSGCGYVFDCYVSSILNNVDRALTGANNSKILDRYTVSAGSVDCTSCGGGQGATVTVKSDRLVDGDDLGCSDICKKCYSITSLCSCECFCQGVIIASTDLNSILLGVINVIFFNEDCNRSAFLIRDNYGVITVEGVILKGYFLKRIFNTNDRTNIKFVDTIDAGQLCIFDGNLMTVAPQVDNICTLINTTVDGNGMVGAANNVDCIAPVGCACIGEVNSTIIKCKLNAGETGINADTTDIIGADTNRIVDHVQIIHSDLNIAGSDAEDTCCRGSNCVSVTVDGDGLANQNYLGSRNVCKKLNSIARLCSCDSICQGCVALSADHCDGLESNNDLAVNLLSLVLGIAYNCEFTGESGCTALNLCIVAICINKKIKLACAVNRKCINNRISTERYVAFVSNIERLAAGIGLADAAVNSNGSVSKVNGSISARITNHHEVGVNDKLTALEYHTPQLAACVAAAQLDLTAIERNVTVKLNAVRSIQSGTILNGDGSLVAGGIGCGAGRHEVSRTKATLQRQITQNARRAVRGALNVRIGQGRVIQYGCATVEILDLNNAITADPKVLVGGSSTLYDKSRTFYIHSRACVNGKTAGTSHGRAVREGYGRVTGCLCRVIVNGHGQLRVVKNEVRRALIVGFLSLPVGAANDGGILGIDHTLIEVCNGKLQLNRAVIIITNDVDTRIGIAIHIAKNEGLAGNGKATGSLNGKLGARITLIVSTGNHRTFDDRSACIIEEFRNVEGNILAQNEGVGAVYPIGVGKRNGYLCAVLGNDFTAKISARKVFGNVSKNDNRLIIIGYSRKRLGKSLKLRVTNLCNVRNLNSYAVSGVAVLIKDYTLRKLYGFGRVVKKSNVAATYSNRCGLCNGSIDLTVYNYAARAVVVHTSDSRGNVNGSTVGCSVKIQLKYAGSGISVILKRYARTVGENDCRLAGGSREIRVLDSQIGNLDSTLGIHLDTADVSKGTTVNHHLGCTVRKHTISIVRTVEGTAGERVLAAGCICTVGKGTIVISNFRCAVNTEREVHKARIGNVATRNLTENKILESNLFAGSLNVALNIEIDLGIRILTNKGNGVIATGKRRTQRNLVVNSNDNVAGHSLGRLKSRLKRLVLNAVNLGNIALSLNNDTIVVQLIAVSNSAVSGELHCTANNLALAIENNVNTRITGHTVIPVGLDIIHGNGIAVNGIVGLKVDIAVIYILNTELEPNVVRTAHEGVTIKGSGIGIVTSCVLRNNNAVVVGIYRIIHNVDNGTGCNSHKLYRVAVALVCICRTKGVTNQVCLGDRRPTQNGVGAAARNDITVLNGKSKLMLLGATERNESTSGVGCRSIGRSNVSGYAGNGKLSSSTYVNPGIAGKAKTTYGKLGCTVSRDRHIVKNNTTGNGNVLINCYCLIGNFTDNLNYVAFLCSVNRSLQGLVPNAVNLGNISLCFLNTESAVFVSLGLEAFSAVLFRHCNGKGTAGNYEFIISAHDCALNRSVAGDGNQHILYFVAISIDLDSTTVSTIIFDHTVGDSQLALLLVSAGGLLTPNTTVCTIDVTASYLSKGQTIAGVAVSIGILHTHTDSDVILADDLAALDIQVSITEAVSAIINNVSHCGAA